MTDLQNNKEMIAVGHEFARTLSSDTPIIEIAKMITRLAGRLDCVTLELREMTKQRYALAAENAGMKAKGREVLKEAAYVYSRYNRMVDHLDGESVDGQTLHEFQEVIEKGTSATNAFLAKVRAQGVDMFAAVLRRKGDDAFFDAIAEAQANAADQFAAQLRKGVQS